MRWDPHAVRASGFSLIEAMIVIALLSTIGASVLAIFIGNSRFYEWSSDAITARQNLHGAMELLATELRQASAADFIAAETDSLSLRFDVSRAVVCDSTSRDRIALVLFDSVRAPNVPSGFRGTAISEPYDSTFTFLDGWIPIPNSSGAGPRSTCAGRGAALKVPLKRYRELSGWASRYGRLPTKGSMIRTYGRLTYRLSGSTFGRGFAVRRNGQEVAAPFDSASGFSYLLADGSEVSSVHAGLRSDVVAVRIRLSAQAEASRSRARRNSPISAEHLIFLRN